VFEITSQMLRYHDARGNYIAEPGDFIAMIGCNCEETQAVRFRLK
jgi:hypothetical protein